MLTCDSTCDSLRDILLPEHYPAFIALAIETKAKKVLAGNDLCALEALTVIRLRRFKSSAPSPELLITKNSRKLIMPGIRAKGKENAL